MPCSGLEHLPNSFTRLGTAFDVTLSTDLLRHSQTFRTLNWSLVHPLQILPCFRVFSEIFLARDEDDRETLAEVKHFRDPLWDVSGRNAITSDNRSKLPFLVRYQASRASQWQNR